jgi:hypothetical protein
MEMAVEIQQPRSMQTKTHSHPARSLNAANLIFSVYPALWIGPLI